QSRHLGSKVGGDPGVIAGRGHGLSKYCRGEQEAHQGIHRWPPSLLGWTRKPPRGIMPAQNPARLASVPAGRRFAMGGPSQRLRGAMILAGGVALGLVVGGGRSTPLRAGAGDRPDAAIVTAGAFVMEISGATKTAIPKDAVYYLNYSRGYLYAAVPMPTKVGN